MNKKILIYQSKVNKPAGGPAAVCYYYFTEQEKRGDHYFEYLPSIESNSNLHKVERIFNKLPLWVGKVYKSLKNIYRINILLNGKYPICKFDFDHYDIVHFHDALSLYTNRFLLKEFKGKIILQSHTPEPPSHELMNTLSPFEKFFIPNIKKRYEKLDRFAFERADFIVFPCKYAEEPYLNNWPYYSQIQKMKREAYRYILTGIPPCFASEAKNNIRKKLHIPYSDFMAVYIGRHNEVKGYDILKRIGKTFLDNTNNSWIVCAGREFPITRLQHSRWIEIGWTTDAHSYISAGDVFVLPNKETYFDIVMLEVLSLGQIVIASRTGGNKYFEKMKCEGVFLYDTEEEAVDLLNRVRLMSIEERLYLGSKNKSFFEKYHTVSSMYDSYVGMLEEISQSF